MRLSGTSSLRGNFEQQAFPLFRLGAGDTSFLDEMMKCNQTAAAEKIKKSIEKSQTDAELKLIYERLSPSSKKVLERLKTEKNDIQKDEWMSLSRELKDAGTLTQSDFDYTRSDGHLIPIGYHDADGHFVKYDTPPMLLEKLHTLSGLSQNSSALDTESWLSSNGWTGDPLEYLNSWMTMLLDWKSDLSRKLAADGSPAFDDFSPIDLQVSSCRKVIDLIEGLKKF